MTYSRIIGTGGYVPETILSNADLEKLVNTSDEWIVKRVGVRERRIIGETPENSTTMAKQAALNAITAAQIDVQSIGMIVVGTATPEFHFPSTACVLQHELGIQSDIPAFDVNAACAGFIYALSIADQYVKSGAISSALVVGVDGLSKLVDWSDRSTCILFGDGAGAVILHADAQPGVLSTHIHANGDHHDLIKSDNTINQPDASQAISMRGSEVFKIAVTKLGDIVEQTIADTGLKKSDIDWLIPHQANFRIIQATAKRLDMPLERVILTIEKHGNTSAASVPLALDYAVRIGKIKRGDTLLLEAFGAGLAWGSALVKY